MYSDRPRWIGESLAQQVVEFLLMNDLLVAGEILTRGLFLALAKYRDTCVKFLTFRAFHSWIPLRLDGTNYVEPEMKP